jgi:hypothetical protein
MRSTSLESSAQWLFRCVRPKSVQSVQTVRLDDAENSLSFHAARRLPPVEKGALIKGCSHRTARWRPQKGS